MIGIHASINHCHNSRTADTKPILRVSEADDVSSRLGRVSMRDEGAVILHQGGVLKPRRNAVNLRLRHRQQLVGLNALDSQERFHEIYREVQQIDDNVSGRRHKKSLIDIAVQRALNLASQKSTEV